MEFKLKKEDVEKVLTLKNLLHSNPAISECSITLEGISSYALNIIVQWLRLHEDEAPKMTEELYLDQALSLADEHLLYDLYPRFARIRDLKNSAAMLGMPDFEVTIAKYVANNLKGLSKEEMSAWLDVPVPRILTASSSEKR